MRTVEFNLFRDVKVAVVANIYKFSHGCRLVIMHTLAKSFERFRQPKSVLDEKKSVDIAVPKPIAYKTKWSCKVLEEWKQNQLVKSCTLEPGSLFATKNFEEGVQTLDMAITDISACSLNYCLSKFLQEVSNSLGECIPSCLLHSIICRLKGHLSDVIDGSATLNPINWTCPTKGKSNRR